MFARRFFPAGYFAPRYFPPVSGVVPPAPDTSSGYFYFAPRIYRRDDLAEIVSIMIQELES